MKALAYDSLDALPARYEPLFTKAGSSSLFHTLAWYRNFARTVVGQGERLRIIAVEGAGGEPRGVLLTRRAGPRSLAGLANYYSSLTGPVLDPVERETRTIIGAMARAIAADPENWDTLDLHPLALGDAFDEVQDALRGAGYLVDRYFCFGNWYLEVNGQPFRDYIRSRPSRVSESGQRKRRRLERSGRLRFELCAGPGSLESALDAYNAVYRSSWKSAEPYPEFIGGWARACAEQGWLRLGVAYVDGQPAAAQFWIVSAGTASIFKLAYDQRFEKESVGTVLSSLLMEHVIDVDRVHTVDYLTGDDQYKRDWMSHRRERWGIVAFNPRTAAGLFAAARHFAGRSLKRLATLFESRRRNRAA